MEIIDQRSHVPDQLGRGPFDGGAIGPDQVRPSRLEALGVLGDRHPEATPETVAYDGVPHSTADPIGHLWMLSARPRAGEGDGAATAALAPSEGNERLTLPDAIDQALNRDRPRRRRARITARPPCVRMRRRKPCFFLRLRVFGWKVRFMSRPPRRGLHGKSACDGSDLVGRNV